MQQSNPGHVIVGCSGGLDSTVLSHAFVQSSILKYNQTNCTLVYVNHNLRTSHEIDLDINHVQQLGRSLGVNVMVSSVTVQKGNVQAQAREARYGALIGIAHELNACVYLAHHANDVAETKLWQFLTGRVVTGINKDHTRDGILFTRPILKFTKEDLEKYARIWSLSWQEDSSNGTNKYTRNRIRHDLIPWVESNVNPGVIRMLGRKD